MPTCGCACAPTPRPWNERAARDELFAVLRARLRLPGDARS
jgi:hypothetical protein